MKKNNRYRAMLRAAEKQIIESVLDVEPSVTAAAAYLGMERSGIYKRMKLLGIPTPRRADADEGADTPSENQHERGQLQSEATGNGEPDVVDDHGDGEALAAD